MFVKRLEVGAMGSNCYLVVCPETKRAVVIDPGAEGKRIVAELNDDNIAVTAIVLTHGHVDHIAACRVVKDETGAALCVHRKDAPMLTSPLQNLSTFVGNPLKTPPPDRLLEEGDEVVAGTIRLTVLHTPGHTPGGICLSAPGACFCGDTLFAGSIGRTDFPGGSYDTLIASIRAKLLTLPPQTVLYPGHGPETTVGEEATANPFLQ